MGEFKCKYMYYQEVGKKVICNIINCITLAIAATGALVVLKNLKLFCLTGTVVLGRDIELAFRSGVACSIFWQNGAM